MAVTEEKLISKKGAAVPLRDFLRGIVSLEAEGADSGDVVYPPFNSDGAGNLFSGIADLPAY